jgi:hypothetical protein
VVDLLARVKLRPADGPGHATVLVHVETQAQPQREFVRRMFGYFARLTLEHALPVYPIAIFSFDRPLRPEISRFDVVLPDLHVLAFQFNVVQLNRLDWRAFLRRPNPVAAALMARMGIAPPDRPRVKAECLRLLVTLRLDPARTRLVSTFVDAYLRLTAEEQKLFEAEIRRAPDEEREKVMELTTSWKEEGRAEGRAEGREEGRAEGRAAGRHEATLDLVLRLLGRRLGTVALPLEDRIRSLRQADLEALAEDLLDFRGLEDLAGWLDRRRG